MVELGNLFLNIATLGSIASKQPGKFREAQATPPYDPLIERRRANRSTGSYPMPSGFIAWSEGTRYINTFRG